LCLKFGIFVNPKRPRIAQNKILKVIQSTGVSYSTRDPDIAIVVGGDGTFGYYGRTLSIPMLFVGVNDPDMLGSKAKLAQILFGDLSKALDDINARKYIIDEKRMFSVNYNGSKSVDILTDIYLERSSFSGCVRYTVSVDKEKAFVNSRHHDSALGDHFTEYAIGNGLIISTAFGSGGYYSYPDRLKPIRQNNRKIQAFEDNKIGVCHILPMYLVRQTNKKKKGNLSKCINYTIPWNSNIKIILARQANARLYGSTKNSKGIAITVDNKINVGPSNRTAKIIKLLEQKFSTIHR
jgi:hypothetical protein